MQATTIEAFRRQLTDRQARLHEAISLDATEGNLVHLLQQVDSALARLGTDDYAQCLVCHEPVDEEDLRRNPLLEYCLCNLSPREQRALEHDLGLARRIQTGLLPDPLQTVAGWESWYHYQPSGVVSGDYCDLWSPPNEADTLYFAVGDVSGKGVAASLLMAHLQAALRSLVGAGVPLGELVARMNRQLLDAGITTHFATLACGRLSADGRVEIVNAGHCPPVVVRTGGIEVVDATGFPVGLLADKPYDVAELTLSQGESLVLYTDGLTEARNPEDDEYGQERLERLLERHAGRDSRAHELVRAAGRDLGLFLNGAVLLDDLTIMALRRRD